MGLRMDDLHAPTVASGPTSSRSTTNGTERQQSLQELIAQKENIEAELSALGSVLDSVRHPSSVSQSVLLANSEVQHNVNMNTPLTTFDGFPRSDIDVPQIRMTRARIIHLKNDHKAIMAKVEAAVHSQFAKAAEATSNGVANQHAVRSTGASNPVIEPPFAKVNSVVPGSPADVAGLKVGDKVTRFGIANFTNHERLSKVAQVVQQNENVSSVTIGDDSNVLLTHSSDRYWSRS